MSDIKLKPCPFCGGEAKILVNLSGMYTICCSNDKCNINVSTKPTPANKEEVINTWNTRKPMDSIVEQLEEALKLTREAQTIECRINDGYGTPLQAKYSGEIKSLLYATEIVRKGGVE